MAPKVVARATGRSSCGCCSRSYGRCIFSCCVACVCTPLRCALQIRAELAEKELALLQKEQELLDKEQTLLVLKEEVSWPKMVYPVMYP